MPATGAPRRPREQKVSENWHSRTGSRLRGEAGAEMLRAVARSGQLDFFVSYTSADRPWAEWIAWELEHAGHSVVIQAWDFAPGSNFVLVMHQAAQRARRTIAVLSPAFLQSPYAAAEWA